MCATHAGRRVPSEQQLCVPHRRNLSCNFALHHLSNPNALAEFHEIWGRYTTRPDSCPEFLCLQVIQQVLDDRVKPMHECRCKTGPRHLLASVFCLWHLSGVKHFSIFLLAATILCPCNCSRDYLQGRLPAPANAVYPHCFF